MALVGVVSKSGSAFTGTSSSWFLNNRRLPAKNHRKKNPVGALYALQVTIRLVGRKGDKWIEEGVDMYQKRLKSANLDLETVWYKTDDALIQSVIGDYQKQRPVILLDPNGKIPSSSEEFATNLYQWLEQGGSRTTFVIGGAQGLPPDLRLSRPSPPLSVTPQLLSLSHLTFPHQLARLLLVEQIYRASEIRKGSEYHK